jgi:ketosteroid isomerase-like protein
MINANSLSLRPAFLNCIAVMLLTTACTQQTPPDTRAAAETAVRAADGQWAKTAQSHDVDGAVSYYADDAVLLPPNAPIAADKQAIRESWAAMLGPAISISWQITKMDIAQSGDLAYLVGTYSLTAKDPHGNPATDRGKLIEIWKKQSDGKWKCVADTYNSDLPAPAA